MRPYTLYDSSQVRKDISEEDHALLTLVMQKIESRSGFDMLLERSSNPVYARTETTYGDIAGELSHFSRDRLLAMLSRCENEFEKSSFNKIGGLRQFIRTTLRTALRST